jgi:hypothetical protein
VSARRRLDETGVSVVEVSVRAPLPVVGALGPAEGLIITGRAFAEDQITGAAP